MLLSPTERIRFTICYPDYSHEQLAKMFKTNAKDVIDTAKRIGIYRSKQGERNDIADEKSTNL